MASHSGTPILVQTVTEKEPLELTDELVETVHDIETTDGKLSYTARTGTIVLKNDQLKDKPFDGIKPVARIGITSYTLNDADATTRPVVFCFNGGPGSASVWLHLGLVGPRIVDLGDIDDLVGPPYRLRDNPHTLLRAADLVIIDAMSTGYSRVTQGEKAIRWHGWEADVEQFSEVIRLWCTKEGRWMSPKFLLGESYGTIRAVSVAQRLQDHYGMYLNGIILLSSVIDFNRLEFEHIEWDEAAINYLPSYAAVAWYHGRHPGVSLEDVIERAEKFVNEEYRSALAQGHRLPVEDYERIARTLAELTGLEESYIKQTRLRIEHERFCAELLRGEGKVIGRLDARFTTWAHRGTAELMDTDPSGDATMGPFVAALHHYLHAELGSREEMNYEMDAQLWKSWEYKDSQGTYVTNASARLERVLQANPHCKIRVEYGYYDLATPYYSAQVTMDHLEIPREVYDSFEHSYFPTGHMPYLSEESRIREADEQCAFIRAASR